MTIEIAKAIDNKITELGNEGCRKFLWWTNLNPAADWATCKNMHRAIRSELAAEDWDDLNELFLTFDPEKAS